MKRLALIFLLACCACSAETPADDKTGNIAAPAQPAAPTRIWLRASDGVAVRGAIYRAEKPRATILLFHQAGSGKDEYATIAPRLAAAGYSALAIDQRSGGSLYGKNETVALTAQPGTDAAESADYLGAKPDLQAAIDWARRQNLPIILWGSSYSSSLVFPVAVENAGKVRAVLAFSPGEYFDDKMLVEHAAAHLTVPAFITSASTPDEIAAARAIAAAVPGGRAEQYVPRTGIHGSSTLIAAKDPGGAEANWQAVLAFLKKVAP
jgi:dienelactone hydrolase